MNANFLFRYFGDTRASALPQRTATSERICPCVSLNIYYIENLLQIQTVNFIISYTVIMFCSMTYL
jgi:hypothetical protein